MTGVDRSIWIEPFLGRAMICRDDGDNPLPAGFFQTAAHLEIDGLHGLLNSRDIFDVTKDINIGKVRKEKGNIFIAQLFHNGIRHSGSIHLRFLIEKRDILWGGDGDPFFPGKRLSDFAIQEKAYVDGFFRFGNFNLFKPLTAQNLTQGIPNFFFRFKSDPDRQFFMIGDHGDHFQTQPLFNLKMDEVRVQKCLTEFHLPFSPKVVKDHIIPVLKSADRFALRIMQHPWFQGLIVILAGLVSHSNGFSHGIIFPVRNQFFPLNLRCSWLSSPKGVTLSILQRIVRIRGVRAN
jgi:hypothetical protein